MQHYRRAVVVSDTYVSRAQVAGCMICGNTEDLRCGACFTCADQVSGKRVAKGHKLWDSNNPDNIWYVGLSPHEREQ